MPRNKDNSVGLPEPQEIKNLKSLGRFGDTEIAHINPVEAAILKSMGGAGTINPHTGMPEYYESGSGPGGRDNTNDNARDTAGPSQRDGDNGNQGGGGDSSNQQPPSSPSFFDQIVDFFTPSKAAFTDPLGTFDKTFQDPKTAGPAVVGALGGTGFGALAAGMQAINDAYFGGEARADVTQDVGGGADSLNDGRPGSSSGGNIPFFGQGTSSPFTFGPVSDWRYQSNNPSAPTQGRLQFLTALNRVTDPNWRRERVGFGTGDELLDSIFSPLQSGAMDYLSRAQNRGMLDVPSYNAALEVLRQQGQGGRATLANRLNEQGESIVQPLRNRAAELQGQILSGQYDTTPFSDAFFDQLFEGASSQVRNRASELGSEYNPFAPATALYAGLEQGGNVQGSPLISVIRSRNNNPTSATRRGVGSRGVF